MDKIIPRNKKTVNNIMNNIINVKLKKFILNLPESTRRHITKKYLYYYYHVQFKMEWRGGT